MILTRLVVPATISHQQHHPPDNNASQLVLVTILTHNQRMTRYLDLGNLYGNHPHPTSYQRHLYMSGAELNQADAETKVIYQNPLYILANVYIIFGCPEQINR